MLDSLASDILAEVKAFAKSSGARGVWFDFGYGETYSYKTVSRNQLDKCWFVAELISKGGSYTLSVNMNGQVLVRIR